MMHPTNSEKSACVRCTEKLYVIRRFSTLNKSASCLIVTISVQKLTASAHKHVFISYFFQVKGQGWVSVYTQHVANRLYEPIRNRRMIRSGRNDTKNHAASFFIFQLPRIHKNDVTGSPTYMNLPDIYHFLRLYYYRLAMYLDLLFHGIRLNRMVNSP